MKMSILAEHLCYTVINIQPTIVDISNVEMPTLREKCVVYQATQSSVLCA